mgnify:CR=1 FL=1
MESYEIIWKDVLPCIQGKMSTINYSFIIERLVPVDLSGTKLVLMTRSNVYTKLASSKILDIIKTADYLIDLGPEGGDGGGALVFAGTPEECAACTDSYTGQFLKKML